MTSMTSMTSLTADDWPALPVALPAEPPIDLPALRERVAKLETELEKVYYEEEELDWDLLEAKADLEKYLLCRSHKLNQIPLHLRSKRTTSMEMRAARYSMAVMETELWRLGHKYTRSNVAEMRKTPLLPGQSISNRTWLKYLDDWPQCHFRQSPGWGAMRDETWELWLAYLEKDGEQQVAK